MLRRILILVMTAAVLSCSSTHEREESTEGADSDEVTQAFVPEAGMSLQSLCDVPGIGWQLDTIYGVCVPDTLVLWATYQGSYLPTNVRGAEKDYPRLTDKGIQTINALQDNDASLTMQVADFAPDARLLYDLDYSPERLREDSNRLLERRVREMEEAALDFFISYGMTKYMAEPLAAVWQKINLDAAADGMVAPNPINGCSEIDFEAGSVSVYVEDASRGIVRVRAYCLDPFTLGHEGWGFWRVTMCREGRFFKVKNPPLLVRPNKEDLYGIE